ncbi:unnamed protein product [Paramecium octaurelia]|uniref:RAD3-like helicase DEAD domain-containing protein n=1 Tax=Paramecium octaurelia TaxID=43137 RepID=A0A8S1U3X2_PAROT|nr:unnamed protein product [Paramecium octaurelia]
MKSKRLKWRVQQMHQIRSRLHYWNHQQQQKTLPLLNASLAQLKKNRKDQQSYDQPKNIKIIYLKRTPTQLKQVAMELKKIVYEPNISILGSRDQYCI